MEQAVQLFAVVHFVVIGLSHLVQPHVWVDFFIWLRSKGHAGVFANGFLSLWFGSLIAAFHNVWSGIPIVLTLLGWAQVLKGLLCFVVPQLNLRGLNHVANERAWELRVGGVAFLGLSGLLIFVLVTN